MVFDFRGIGESLHEPLKKSKASIVQWGQLDIPAAMEVLLNKTQTTQVILLGHSAGGQLLGINPNYEKVAKVIAVAGSTFVAAVPRLSHAGSRSSLPSQ